MGCVQGGLDESDGFHHHGKFVRGFSPSLIVLIPKKTEALSLSDFSLISLIGGIYKIISKSVVDQIEQGVGLQYPGTTNCFQVLSIKLSKVLDSNILEQQSAFIGGWQILDSVVVLNEAMVT